MLNSGERYTKNPFMDAQQTVAQKDRSRSGFTRLSYQVFASPPAPPPPPPLFPMPPVNLHPMQNTQLSLHLTTQIWGQSHSQRGALPPPLFPTTYGACLAYSRRFSILAGPAAYNVPHVTLFGLQSLLGRQNTQKSFTGSSPKMGLQFFVLKGPKAIITHPLPRDEFSKLHTAVLSLRQRSGERKR